MTPQRRRLVLFGSAGAAILLLFLFTRQQTPAAAATDTTGTEVGDLGAGGGFGGGGDTSSTATDPLAGDLWPDNKLAVAAHDLIDQINSISDELVANQTAVTFGDEGTGGPGPSVVPMTPAELTMLAASRHNLDPSRAGPGTRVPVRARRLRAGEHRAVRSSGARRPASTTSSRLASAQALLQIRVAAARANRSLHLPAPHLLPHSSTGSGSPSIAPHRGVFLV